MKAYQVFIYANKKKKPTLFGTFLDEESAILYLKEQFNLSVYESIFVPGQKRLFINKNGVYVKKFAEIRLLNIFKYPNN
jgi:hypothetical protein